MPEQYDNTSNEHTNDNSVSSQQDGTLADKPTPPPDPAKRRRNTAMGIVVVLVLVCGCVAWWLHARNYESTDDAQVDGHLNPIAARVAGTITAVYVDDNQAVHAGQPIVDLDTRDAEVSLAQAQADYDQASAQVNAETPNVPITQTSNRTDVASAVSDVVNANAALEGAQRDYDSDVAKLHQAEATSMKSQNDVIRYKQLMDKNELARSDYDQYVSTAKANAASTEAAAATVASQSKLIEQRRAQLQQQQVKQHETIENAPRQVAIKNADASSKQASLKAYSAKLDQAKLNLAYCHVVAPVDGIILQRSAELGGRVSDGQQLLMIAQVESPWVIANFKETQIRKMRPGQSVVISVDALNRSFNGTIEDMPAATGDRASVLPSQNATGNYVKVIQRLPIRIVFKSGQAGLEKLRPGMSVEPNVHLN